MDEKFFALRYSSHENAKDDKAIFMALLGLTTIENARRIRDNRKRKNQAHIIETEQKQKKILKTVNKSTKLLSSEVRYTCENCGEEGRLYKCKTCPARYHFGCLKRHEVSLDALLSEAWLCPFCQALSNTPQPAPEIKATSISVEDFDIEEFQRNWIAYSARMRQEKSFYKNCKSVFEDNIEKLSRTKWSLDANSEALRGDILKLKETLKLTSEKYNGIQQAIEHVRLTLNGNSNIKTEET
eukprot:m.62007 g.62007  ORF g.62007 m.62007 type:complete len:241 (+) comp11475_c0_seq1:247-969(+)